MNLFFYHFENSPDMPAKRDVSKSQEGDGIGFQ